MIEMLIDVKMKYSYGIIFLYRMMIRDARDITGKSGIYYWQTYMLTWLNMRIIM